jgi:serine/threonine-protein kinase
MKVVWPHLACDAETLGRFSFEERIGRTIRSAHVPRVLEAGKTERELPYTAFELVAGRPLSHWLCDGSGLPIAAAVDLGCQLFSALEDVHGRGLVHCDVKPANVLMAQESSRGCRVMLVDFGIARPTSFRGEDSRTGTPAYMSPEQILGGRLNEATDVYSASCVLYVALTGHKPFVGVDLETTLDAILYEDPLPPSLIRAGCPRELDAIVLRGLARRPRERFSTARSVRDALRAVARDRGLPCGAGAWSRELSWAA